MSAGDSTALVAELDERDREIVQQRCSAFLSTDGPQVGDFVRFADGVERRISYIWPEGCAAGVQTSHGGRFYFGNGYCSFSGSLYSGIDAETLTLTDTCRRGSCWFFHHDHHCAHNGVDVTLPIFNEWSCSLESTR